MSKTKITTHSRHAVNHLKAKNKSALYTKIQFVPHRERIVLPSVKRAGER